MFASEPDPLAAAQRAEADRVAMIARVSPAVVCIFDEGLRGGGAGVIIDEAGYGITNFHVVADMLETRHGQAGLSDGKLYDLDVLGIDPGGDLAMFRLRGRDRFPAAPLGDSDQVRVGDRVFAMGNPFMLSEDYTPTVTMGIVSGIHRYQWGQGDQLLYSDCIQVDASINPGNSGGPLFNDRGEVIGINGRISVSMRGRLNVGLGYAITAGQIKTFMPGLRAGLLVEHGTLQAIARDMPDGSVVFVELFEDGPAAKVGVRPGDRLLSIDGRPIRSANEYASILGTLPADWPVAIGFEQPGGTVLHRIARTEPIRLKQAEGFEPDGGVNLDAAWRTVGRFQEALADDGDPTDEWFGRFKPAGRATVDPAFVEDAISLLRETIIPATDRAQVSDMRHLGASRLLNVDNDGRVVESRVLERLEMPVQEHAVADYDFDVQSGRLRRIVITDKTTQDTETLLADSHSAAAGQTPSTKPAEATMSDLVDRVNERVVKLYGAKAGRAVGYGCGILVSTDGLALTVDSVLLDERLTRAVLADGTNRSIKIVRADRDLQLALIKLVEDPAVSTKRSTYPYFKLDESVNVQPGEWVLAAGNPFKVAAGAEPASFSLATFGGTTRLDATRAAFDFPYQGQVIVLDAVTSTPGYPGGAVVDLDGRLVGMIGRMVEARATHTMLNHAIPADVLARFVAAATSADSQTTEPAGEEHRPGYHGMRFFELGYRSNPVFVDHVKRGSPAARAGIRKDDLIISANGRPMPKLADLERLLDSLAPGDKLELTIKRGDKVKIVSLALEESP